ncbi:DNA-binding protein HEXBP [Tanacetum coccineum]
MIDYLSIVETDKVNHAVETDMVKLVVEIESFGMSADELDKETGSSDGLQPKQADLSCVHALNEPHLHEIHVVPSKHEADQWSSRRQCNTTFEETMSDSQTSCDGKWKVKTEDVVDVSIKILLLDMCFKCYDNAFTSNSDRHFDKMFSYDLRGGINYATCVICNEQGHLSKDCPKNAHGIYPTGGCCKLCGGVTHLARDCPNKGNRNVARIQVTYFTIRRGRSNEVEARGEASVLD